MVRARIAVMADIDFETVLEEAIIDLVCAEEEGQFRLFGRQHLDATVISIAEHQPAHACCRKMENVEAVPTIFDQLILFGERESRAVDAFITQRAASDDNRGAFGGFQGIGKQFWNSRQRL